jgi:hypothetical protein
MEGKGEIRLADGSVAVSAQAKYIRLTEEQTETFRQELGFWQVIPDGSAPSDSGQGEPERQS